MDLPGLRGVAVGAGNEIRENRVRVFLWDVLGVSEGSMMIVRLVRLLGKVSSVAEMGTGSTVGRGIELGWIRLLAFCRSSICVGVIHRSR